MRQTAGEKGQRERRNHLPSFKWPEDIVGIGSRRHRYGKVLRPDHQSGGVSNVADICKCYRFGQNGTRNFRVRGQGTGIPRARNYYTLMWLNSYDSD
jgi:hypothetical protein